MYFLSIFFLRWINLWRLPESDQSKRTQTPQHLIKIEKLRVVWLVSIPLLAITGGWAVIVVGTSLLLFLTLMFLDEV